MVGNIKLAQQLGFSLREIGENLPLLWSSEGASGDLVLHSSIASIQRVGNTPRQVPVVGIPIDFSFRQSFENLPRSR